MVQSLARLFNQVQKSVGGADKVKATVRVVAGGVLAMAITFGIGKLFGVIGI